MRTERTQMGSGCEGWLTQLWQAREYETAAPTENGSSKLSSGVLSERCELFVSNLAALMPPSSDLLYYHCTGVWQTGGAPTGVRCAVNDDSGRGCVPRPKFRSCHSLKKKTMLDYDQPPQLLFNASATPAGWRFQTWLSPVRSCHSVRLHVRLHL